MYRAFSYNGRRQMSRQIIEGIAETVKLPDGGKGLDVGCGSGALTIACAKRNPNASFIGIDRWGKEYASFSKPLCENNAKAEGVTVLPSGVQYKVLKEGTGAMPKDTSRVKVHYEGRTLEGKVFDSSYKRGEPINLRCNQTIKGWTDAMVHMPAGSVWEVYIPQDLAYGEREQGDIKPFSCLIFKIELLEVNPKK
jgi:hypothetical protein